MERERKEHKMSHFTEQQPHKGRVGALPQDQRGFCGTSVGPDKENLGTLVPQKKQAVGGLQRGPQRRPPTNDNKEALRQTCFKQTGVVLTFGIMHGSGVDSRN